jgi:Zn-dependent M32 family carboxypeptidase
MSGADVLPPGLAEKVTGEGLSVSPFLKYIEEKYIEEKYTEIYGI